MVVDCYNFYSVVGERKLVGKAEFITASNFQRRTVAGVSVCVYVGAWVCVLQVLVRM